MREVDSDTINTVGFWLLGLLLLVGVAFGAGSCVERDWRFENACRAAGGVVMNASTVSGAGVTGKDICAKVVQSPLATPLPLPGYKP